MFFSILVPVYNSEPYLKECFDSVLRQSEQDFELVLVNDGSVDGGGMICDRYRAMHPDRVKVLHQANKGLILTRRVGISMAEGKYCVFLDADDALEPDCLATIRETIERTGADIVIYNNYSFFEEEQVTEPNQAVFTDNTEFSGESKRQIYEVLISSWRLNNIWMKAVRTPLLKSDDTPYEKYADNPHGEDLLQTLYPMTHANRVVYRDRALYRYRRHSKSITRRIDFGRIDQILDVRVHQLLRRYMTIWGMDTPESVGRLQSRRIGTLLSVFWQYYRIAETNEQKQAILGYDWVGRVAAIEDGNKAADNLSRSQRLQLWAIRKRSRVILNLIETIGTIRMRSAYEQ